MNSFAPTPQKMFKQLFFCLHFILLIHFHKDLHHGFIYSSIQHANMINVSGSSHHVDMPDTGKKMGKKR